MNSQDLWQSFTDGYWQNWDTGIAVDLSRMNMDKASFAAMEPRLKSALAFMAELEGGAIANPDEDRMVGHYWLRNPSLAPTPELREGIDDAFKHIRAFVTQVHNGFIRPPMTGIDRFTHFLLIGIGGSALGPQLVADALTSADDAMQPAFIDNTDPDGIDRVLAAMGEVLPRTLVIVVSKSGGTKETRNGMLEARRAFEALALDFPKHAVAVTREGSKLEALAKKEGFLRIFPMWDWIGGRTSETSAVGFLPGALQGVDMDGFLSGAAAMDELTRNPDPSANPAAVLAAAWYTATKDKHRAMVVLPYKDRLQHLARYLQQLVMESLGKEFDLDGKPINHGLTVYGNKGSTDQHAYVQQLREGPDDFFVNFVQVLKDRSGRSMEVESGAATGDFLLGFMLGTRQALYEKGHPSLTITLDALTPDRLGALIALYERTVGIYAHMLNINAYNQPGVEAGKVAAESVLELQGRVVGALAKEPGRAWTAEELAGEVGEPQSAERVFHLLLHLAANSRRGITVAKASAPKDFKFSMAQVPADATA